MTCLKCGRETDQTFCESCREVMEKYPVKPGTILQIPKRQPSPKRVPVRRAAVSPDVQIAKQRKLIRRLILIIFCMTLIMGAMGHAIFRLTQGKPIRPVGQNYTTVTKPTEEPGAVPPETK